MERNKILKIGILILILIFTISNISAWYNESENYRQLIDISTSSGSTETNYQINLILNSANVGTNFNWNNDCDDLRFIEDDDTTELDYFIESCSNTNQNASIWIKIPNSITTSNTNIYMYYGDTTLTNESNPENTFDFYDDFSGDLSKWTKHKNPGNLNIVSNALEISGGITSGLYGHSVLGSDATYNTFQNGIIEGDIYLITNSIAEIGFRGNYATNTGYKSRLDARSGQGLSHLKPPYSGWGFLGSCSVSGTGIGINTWLPFKLTVSGTTFKLETQTYTKTCTDSQYSAAGEISLQNHYGVSTSYDNIRVRKYFANNININLNSEEEFYTIIDSCQSLLANKKYKLNTSISNFNADCFIFTGNNILFTGDGFTVDGQNAGEAFTTNNNGYENLTIINTLINDFSYGFRFRNSNDILIKNVSVNSPYNYGFRCDNEGCNNVEIINTSFIDVTVDDGIYFYNSNNIDLNNLYFDSVGNGNYDYGMYFYNSTNVNITDIISIDTYYSMMRFEMYSSDIEIKNVFLNNTIAGGGNGIGIISNSHDVLIKNVSMYNINSDGVELNQNVSNIIIDNIYIKNAGVRGIYCEDNNLNISCQNLIIKNSIIDGTLTNNGISIDRGGKSITIDNVDLYNIGNSGDRGISLYYSQDVVIKDVNIFNVSNEGIYGTNSLYNTDISNVNISLCGYDGIEFTTDIINVTMNNVNITNVGTTGGADGIRISTGGYNYNFNNIFIQGATDDGIEIVTNISNVNLWNTQIYDVYDFGIYGDDGNIIGWENGSIINLTMENIQTDDAMNFDRANNLVIKNVDIKNVGDGGVDDYLLYMRNSSNVIIENFSALDYSGSIRFETNSVNNTFKDITLIDGNSYGIYINSYSGGNSFENIYIDDTQNTGIDIYTYSPNNTFKNININDVKGGAASCMYFTTGSDNLIIDNVSVSNCGDYGMYFNINNISLSNLEISDTADDGIYKGAARGNFSLINGSIENSLSYGIYLDDNLDSVYIDNLSIIDFVHDGLNVDFGAANSVFRNINIDSKGNSLTGYDGMSVYQAYDSIFENIIIKNLGTYGLHFRQNDRSTVDNIYINNSGNYGFYNDNSYNFSVYNLTSNYASYGIYSNQADNSNWNYIQTNNNVNDGMYMRYLQNGNFSHMESRFNGNYGLYILNSDDIIVNKSDFRDNTNINVRLNDVDNSWFYFNYIGDDILHSNWAQESRWNTTTYIFDFGNYWSSNFCQESILVSYLGEDYQVCNSDDYILNLANSRIDSGPIFPFDYFINISFVIPTPLNNSIQCANCIYVNVSEGGHLQRSSYLDWDKTIYAYYSFEESSGVTVYDNSSYSNDALIIGAASIENVGRKRGNYIRFNGIDEYISNSNIDNVLSGTSSLSFWIRTTQIGSDTMWQAPGITGVENSGGGDDVFWGWIDASGHIGVMKGNTYAAKSTTAINNGDWNHVVLIRNATSGMTSVYVNGVLESSALSETGIVTTPFSSIGRIEDTGGTPVYFDGDLDEVVIYDRIISPIEINASYNSNLYNLAVNMTGLARTNHTIKAMNINLMGNYSQTEERKIILSNQSANVTVNSPIIGQKYFDTDIVYANISSSVMLNNVTYYLDGNLSNSVNLTFIGGFNWAIQMSNLTLGLHNITFNYIGGCGIVESKFGGNFYLLKNYSTNSIKKSILASGIGLYDIKIEVSNVNGNATNITNVEFIDNTLNSGSWSPFYDFINSTFIGEYLGWNSNYAINEKKEINYSIAGIGNSYEIRKSYVIGLD